MVIGLSGVQFRPRENGYSFPWLSYFFPSGLGYMKEYPYERVMRDSRILLIFEVSNMLWVNFETLCKEGFFRGSIYFRFYWWMFVYKTGHLPLKILPTFPFFLCLTGNKRNPPNVHSSCRNAACWKTLARSIKVSCYLRNVKWPYIDHCIDIVRRNYFLVALGR